MTLPKRQAFIIAGVILLFLIEALFVGTWNTTLNMVNYSLIAAIIALGVNIQWGYAGLFSVGIVGFVGLGGLAPVIISSKAQPEAFAAGGWQIIGAMALGAAAVVAAILVYGRTTGRVRFFATLAVIVAGFFAYRAVFDPAVMRVEAINPENAGNLGGLGLDSILGLHRQDRAWTALGLSRHRHTRDQRNHPRRDPQRRLARARGQEPDRHPPPRAVRG
jgi:branched-chain amino acid transport system permease protein